MFTRAMWARIAMFISSLACAGAAYAEKNAAPIVGLLSLPTLLAAFAGSGLILSFLPPSKASNGRLFLMVVACAGLGALAASMVVRVAAKQIPGIDGPGAELVAAFLIGAIGQYGIPEAIERRSAIFDRILPNKGKGG